MDLKSVIAAALTEKYKQPWRLHIAQVAEELGLDVRTLRNQLSKGTFPVPTFSVSRDRYCLISDLSCYLAELAEAGRQQHKALRRRLGLDR